MFQIPGIDLTKLVTEAESQSSKAAETQIRNWIKSLWIDECNLRLKARRLREEADSVEAKAKEKADQLLRLREGD